MQPRWKEEQQRLCRSLSRDAPAAPRRPPMGAGAAPELEEVVRPAVLARPHAAGRTRPGHMMLPRGKEDGPNSDEGCEGPVSELSSPSRLPAPSAKMAAAAGSRMRSPLVAPLVVERMPEVDLQRLEMAVLGVSPEHARSMQMVFAHYAGWAGEGARIGLSRFRRVLRDLGLLGESGERLLTVVQADLIYTRATGTNAEKQTLPSMDLYAFCMAVGDAAMQFFLEADRDPETAVLRFCDQILGPVAGRMLDDGQDVADGARYLEHRAVSTLFQRSDAGLGTVFLQYAQGVGCQEPYRKGHWSVTQLARFTADYGLSIEVSHAAMNRLFSHCAQLEAVALRGLEGKLSFAGFRLLLVVVAQRVQQGSQASPAHRIAQLLLRLSAVRRPGQMDLTQMARAARDVCSPARSLTKRRASCDRKGATPHD